MNEEQKPAGQSGKKAGSIRQYATLGKASANNSVDKHTTQIIKIQQSDIQAYITSETRPRKSAETQGKGSRKQKTVYLSPGLARRLNIYAAESEQEISEIAEAALDEYLTRLGK